ncbi:MAG: VanW family protein [Candidatus Choladocola sp.]|nr:VanW family protein [Clostridiaceae bacterium]MDY4547389.1 VanW family protein [Candidatus Choladocola sp.]
MKKWKGSLLLAICLLAMTSSMTVCAAGETILKGVSIDKLDVSGMTREEALAALESYEKNLGGQSIKLGIGDNVIEAKLSDLGVTFDNEDLVDEAIGVGHAGNIVKRYKDQKDLQHSGKTFPLSWQTNEDTVRTYVENNCTKYDKKAQNASLTRENGAFNFVAGTEGLELNVDSAVRTISDYLENSWTSDNTEVLNLETQVTEPEGSAEELENIKDLLGSFTTSFSTSGSNRCKNVSSGASHINGTVLYPGEEFSAYETVSPFTEANGYAMAGSYLNGEVVDSMGGGICQVSTTLYNAVLRAELNVTERSPHSMTVHYVDLSEDAAIAGTYKDFKFVNSTEYPIYIEGYTTSDKKITFNIYGKETRDKNRTISFESQIVSETPATTILQEDAGQGIGYKAVSSKGSSGYVAELYKIVKVNGVETDRIKVNKSTYKGTNRVVTYGTAGDPTLSENLRAAIAAQDEALADANIAAAVPAQ